MSILFEPTTIGNIAVKNRFIRSAAYYGLADDNGFVGETSVNLIKSLAQHDVGLVITGNTYVVKSGQRFPNANCLFTDDHIHGFRKMAQAVHDIDGRVVMQIGHNGVQARLAAQSGEDYLAVSLTEDLPDFGRRPKEMDEEDIQTVIHAFSRAGWRAREAGFDGVQIHGAHGYLVNQFLSPLTNRRKDRWGGSLENRMRFVVEVVRGVKSAAGEDFPVMIKLGAKDYVEGDIGQTPEESALVAKRVAAEGVCLVEISHAALAPRFRKIMMGIDSPEKEAVFLAEARVVRKETDVPIALVAGMRSLPVMEEVVRSGAADFISLCRPLIREPDLITRWKAGDTRPAACISCPDPTGMFPFGCFNLGADKKIAIYCRQLKKKESS